MYMYIQKQPFDTCKLSNVYRDLQGLCRGFSARENPAIFTSCRGIAGKICIHYKVFPEDIAKKPRRVPVNPCKHLLCVSG